MSGLIKALARKSGVFKAKPVRSDEVAKGGCDDLPVAVAVAGAIADAETEARPVAQQLFNPPANNSLARAGEPVEFWKPVFKSSTGYDLVKQKNYHARTERNWLVHLERVPGPACVLFVHENGTCDVAVEVRGKNKPDVYYRANAFQLRPVGESLNLRAWFQPGTRVLCAHVDGSVQENSMVRRGCIVNQVYRNGADFVGVKYDCLKDHVEFYVPLEAVGLNWKSYCPPQPKK